MKKIFIVGLILVLVAGIVGCGKTERDWNSFSYKVSPGDTLTSIAQAYCPDDMHIQEYIYELKKHNNMPNSTIYEGEILSVLTDEKCIIDMYDVVDIKQTSDDVFYIVLADGNYYSWEK